MICEERNGKCKFCGSEIEVRAYPDPPHLNYVKRNELKFTKVGEMYMSSNLPHNLLTCADYFFYYFNKPEKNRFWGQHIVNLATFYELFFKYKMTLIHKSLIWKKIEEFNEDKYSEANFTSLEAFKVLQYAKTMKWISDANFNSISELFKIRNKFIHFSLCAEDESGHVKFAYFKSNFEIKHKNLVKKLLLDNEKDFDGCPDYPRIKNDYLLKNRRRSNE